MGFIEDSFVRAKEVIDIAGKKTGEIISLQKLKVDASALEYQISKDYETLGRLYYDNRHKRAENETAIDALIAELEQKTTQLSEIEIKIAIAKGIRICPACATSNPDTAAYCNKCGQKLTFETHQTEDPAEDPAAEQSASQDVPEESGDTEN